MALFPQTGQGSGYWGVGPQFNQPLQSAFVGGRFLDFDERRALQGQTPGAPVAPDAAGGPFPKLPDYSQISEIIGQINATNQQAQTSALNARIPGGPALEQQSSQFIGNLFGDANTPGRVFAELDVPAASSAVASGTVGSPFAGSVGMMLTENERIRRGGLGQQYLSGALARNPAAPIADPSRLVEMGAQQAFAGEQAGLDRALRERIANAEMANRALQMRNYNRGGGGYGPNIPIDYGRGGGMSAGGGATFSPNIPGGPRPPSLPPIVGPGGVPNIGGLENWSSFDPGTQSAFNAAFATNPYFGMPDYLNPYSGDLSPTQLDIEDFYNYT